jgi:tRNA threonylcarbamoyladenosine biosynthesis protein TsaE
MMDPREPDGEQATKDCGRELAARLAGGSVLALCGDLGSGKTCLTKGIVAGLGSPAAVTSPTFTLIHEYPGGRLEIAHFDFYRVRSAEELVAAGWDDYLDRGGVMIVEWADRFPGLFPEHTTWLQLEADGNARFIREMAAPPGAAAADQ